jgi:hypothetical protein
MSRAQATATFPPTFCAVVRLVWRTCVVPRAAEWAAQQGHKKIQCSHILFQGSQLLDKSHAMEDGQMRFDRRGHKIAPGRTRGRGAWCRHWLSEGSLIKAQARATSRKGRGEETAQTDSKEVSTSLAAEGYSCSSAWRAQQQRGAPTRDWARGCAAQPAGATLRCRSVFGCRVGHRKGRSPKTALT